MAERGCNGCGPPGSPAPGAPWPTLSWPRCREEWMECHPTAAASPVPRVTPCPVFPAGWVQQPSGKLAQGQRALVCGTSASPSLSNRSLQLTVGAQGALVSV